MRQARQDRGYRCSSPSGELSPKADNKGGTMPTAEQIQSIIAPLFPGLMGVEVQDVTPEKVVASMPVRPDLCTTGGVCHGGALMAFADTVGAIGTVANLPPGARTTTIESKTNFMGAAPAMLATLLLSAADATAQSSGKFTNKPPISCAFGKVVDGRCVCPPGWQRVHAGLNAWRCLRPDPWIGSQPKGGQRPK